jgi:hypothetical protein
VVPPAFTVFAIYWVNGLKLAVTGEPDPLSNENCLNCIPRPTGATGSLEPTEGISPPLPVALHQPATLWKVLGLLGSALVVLCLIVRIILERRIMSSICPFGSPGIGVANHSTCLTPLEIPEIHPFHVNGEIGPLREYLGYQ